MKKIIFIMILISTLFISCKPIVIDDIKPAAPNYGEASVTLNND